MKGELGTADSIAKASKIYESIGVYLGYATAQYLEFYDFSFFLILGRVTKGAGGDIVIAMAEKVRPCFSLPHSCAGQQPTGMPVGLYR